MSAQVNILFTGIKNNIEMANQVPEESFEGGFAMHTSTEDAYVEVPSLVE